MKHIKLFEAFVNEAKLPKVIDFYKVAYGDSMAFQIDGYEIIYDDKMKVQQVPYYPGDNKLGDAAERKAAKKMAPKYMSGFKKLATAGIALLQPMGGSWEKYLSSLINIVGSDNLIEFGMGKNVKVEVTDDGPNGYVRVIAMDGDNEIYNQPHRIPGM